MELSSYIFIKWLRSNCCCLIRIVVNWVIYISYRPINLLSMIPSSQNQRSTMAFLVKKFFATVTEGHIYTLQYLAFFNLRHLCFIQYKSLNPQIMQVLASLMLINYLDCPMSSDQIKQVFFWRGHVKLYRGSNRFLSIWFFRLSDTTSIYRVIL